MGIVIDVGSFLLIAIGALGLLCVDSYWIILRMNDVDHRVNPTRAVRALVVVALGVVGLLWAGSIPGPAQML